jgi:predicted nucleic acid-binding protein
MSDNAFVDTNILVYARDAGAGEKQVLAAALLDELWRSRRGRISVQVLNEYYVTVTQKLRPGMPQEAAWSDLVALRAWDPVPLDWPLMEQAHWLHGQYALSWWDALVVAAAEMADCATLYSEDLTHGAAYGRVQVINPFRVPA